MQPKLQWLNVSGSTLIALRRAVLVVGIISLPLGHLFGIISFLILAGLSISSTRIEWRSPVALMGLPLVVGYVLVVGAEILSPNTFDVTLETAFNYLPLLLLPIIYSGCWRSGISVQFIIRTVIVASVVMAVMAFTEVVIVGQRVADGNVWDLVSIASHEFALVAFLYAAIIALAFFTNREPFLNPIPMRFLCLGILCCLLSILFTRSILMWFPIGIALVVALFVIAQHSHHRWIAPLLLIVGILGATGLSGLPMVQEQYALWFNSVADALIEDRRQGFLAERMANWLAGWKMAQSSAIFGFGNIAAQPIALEQFRLEGWPEFAVSFHFHSGLLDHFVLFGGIGLAGILIVLFAPMMLIGPSWFQVYVGIVVLATSLFALISRFMNNDSTGSAMLVIWLVMLLTQSLLGARRP